MSIPNSSIEPSNIKMRHVGVEWFAPLGNSSGARVAMMDPTVDPRPLPTFPDLATMPGESAALNDIAVSAAQVKLTPSNISNVDPAAVEYENLKGGVRGYRTGVQPVAPKSRNFTYTQVEPEPETINTARYYSVLAAAEHGWKAVDEDVLSRVITQRGIMGNGQYARNAGYDRVENKAIPVAPAVGFKRTAITGVSSNDDLRINDSRVRPVLAAAPNV